MKISVIIPAYNEEKNIALCISSLLHQKSKDVEIIVVNDHSNDSTLKVLKHFSEYIKIVNLKKRGGVANARNSGANVACGEIISFIDADSIAGPFWLKSIKKDMKRNVAIVGPIKPLYEENVGDHALFDSLENLVRISLKFKPLTPGSNFACKKKYFKKIGGFSKIKSLEDVDFGYKLSKFGEIGFSKKMIVYSSVRRFKKSKLETINYFKNYLRLLNKRPTKKMNDIR